MCLALLWVPLLSAAWHRERGREKKPRGGSRAAPSPIRSEEDAFCRQIL